jgi:hypothetical protein
MPRSSGLAPCMLCPNLHLILRSTALPSVIVTPNALVIVTPYASMIVSPYVAEANVLAGARSRRMLFAEPHWRDSDQHVVFLLQVSACICAWQSSVFHLAFWSTKSTVFSTGTAMDHVVLSITFYPADLLSRDMYDPDAFPLQLRCASSGPSCWSQSSSSGGSSASLAGSWRACGFQCTSESPARCARPVVLDRCPLMQTRVVGQRPLVAWPKQYWYVVPLHSAAAEQLLHVPRKCLMFLTVSHKWKRRPVVIADAANALQRRVTRFFGTSEIGIHASQCPHHFVLPSV